MIVSFNPEVFKLKDEDTQNALAEIFNLISSERFLVKIENVIGVFFDEDGNYIFDSSDFAQKYLSKYRGGKLREYISLIISKNAYITDMHNKYLTSITIGVNKNEIIPADAFKILKETSKIVVENATNDWKFVKGICDKYKDHKKRKTIYQLVNKAIINNWIEPENAGGMGQIKNRVLELGKARYKDISKYKLGVLFDSDRNSNTELKVEQKRLIEFLKGIEITDLSQAIFDENDQLVWHILYKREIENYISMEILSKEPMLSDKLELLKNKTAAEYDFLDFEAHFGSREFDVKNKFPEFFLNAFTRDQLENRCSHHKKKIELPNGTLEDVSEIEEILIKIAKII